MILPGVPALPDVATLERADGPDDVLRALQPVAAACGLLPELWDTPTDRCLAGPGLAPATIRAVATPSAVVHPVDDAVGVVQALGEAAVLVWIGPGPVDEATVTHLGLVGQLVRLALHRIGGQVLAQRAHTAQMKALTALLPDRAAPVGEPLVRALLHTVPASPDLIAVRARVSVSSRGEPRWVGWPADPDADEVAELNRQREWLRPGEPRVIDGETLLYEPVGADGRQGDVIGRWRVVSLHPADRAALADIARTLTLSIHLLRWSADSAAVAAVTRSGSEGVPAHQRLGDTVAEVCRRLDADGVRLVVQARHPAGPRPRQLHGEAIGPAPEQLLAALSGHRWSQSIGQDAETWHLAVPLPGHGPTDGALEVWRRGPEPFALPADAAALASLTPHVAAATHAALHDELLAERVTLTARLLARLDPGTSVQDAARIVLHEVGTFARASAGVLVRRAPGNGPLYVEAAWTDDVASQAAFEEAARDRLFSGGGPDWPAAVQATLAEHLEAWGRGDLQPRPALPSPHVAATAPTSAILLFDAPSNTPPARFGIVAHDQLVAELSAHGAALLENATRSLSRATADALRPAADEVGLLGPAAARLREAASLDAVVIATGDRGGLTIRVTDPPRPSLHGRPLPDDPTALADAFGWRGVRSRRVVPLREGEHPLGAVLALTAEGGAWVGWHRDQVLDAVAERLATVLADTRKSARRDALNQLSEDLAGKAGTDLARAVYDGLRRWVHAHLRVGADVIVLARAHAQQALLTAAAPDADPEALHELHRASRRWQRQARTFTPSGAEADHGGPPAHALAVPLDVRSATPVTGHLLVRHPAAWDAHDRDVLAEAARELVVVLDAERVRHGFMAASGLFRHALLSPIQGLTDAALFVAELSEQAQPDAELLSSQRDRLLAEAARVRHWRTIQRLYGGGLLGGAVSLRPRRQAVHPGIVACLRRFDRQAASRGQELRLVGVRQTAPVHHDREAFEIALSNLLDNACKYGFERRRIEVGVAEHDRHVEVWVEDIGHRLPPELELYVAGHRAGIDDPLRTIHGDGLGLVVVRSLIVAHGGDVGHACRPENPHAPPGREETRPWVVRFTLTLPRGP